MLWTQYALSLTFPPLGLLFLFAMACGAVVVLILLLILALILTPPPPSGTFNSNHSPTSWSERVKASKQLLSPIRLPLVSALSFSAQCTSLGFLIAIKSTKLGFAVGATIISGILALTQNRRKLNSTVRFISEVCGYSELITVTVLTINSHITNIALQTTLQGLQLGEHLSLGGMLSLLMSTGFWGSISSSTLTALGHTKDLVVNEVEPVANEMSLPNFFAAISRVKEGERAKTAAAASSIITKDLSTALWAEYVGHAIGVYGEKGLKFLSIIPYGSATTNIEAFLQLSNVPSSLDVISSDFEGELYSPGYVLSVNQPDEAIVLAVRGTLMPHDFLTDLVCYSEKLPAEFNNHDDKEEEHFAHSGMLKSARNLSASVLPLIQNLLSRRKYKSYKVVLTGHSLGAGVAGLITAIWKTTHLELYQRTQCYGYGMPAILTEDVGKSIASHCTSIVIGGDMVPRFSLRSFRLLRDSVLNELRSSRGSEPFQDRCGAEGMPVLLPAGKVVWIDDGDDLVNAFDGNNGDFDSMPMTVCSFQAHMPQNYYRIMKGCSAKGVRGRGGEEVERSRCRSFFG